MLIKSVNCHSYAMEPRASSSADAAMEPIEGPLSVHRPASRAPIRGARRQSSRPFLTPASIIGEFEVSIESRQALEELIVTESDETDMTEKLVLCASKLGFIAVQNGSNPPLLDGSFKMKFSCNLLRSHHGACKWTASLNVADGCASVWAFGSLKNHSHDLGREYVQDNHRRLPAYASLLLF